MLTICLAGAAHQDGHEKEHDLQAQVSEDTFVVLAGFWCRLLEVHGSDGLAGPACQEEGCVIYFCVVCVCDPATKYLLASTT